MDLEKLAYEAVDAIAETLTNNESDCSGDGWAKLVLTRLERARDEAFAHERSYLITCPWCGEAMEGRPISSQMLHLIPCGDKAIAKAGDGA